MKVVTLFFVGLVVASSANAANIEFVTVGNPGNTPDTRSNGFSIGAVDHVYRIGKYEVTAGQYTEFLNAVAKADPNGLYNASMSVPGGGGITGRGANIQRAGSSPDYSYSVAADWANRPVNYVSFWDAARFANWLHNGQPIGPQGPGTTEDGAYHDVGNQTLFGRNPDARFFIPTHDEWYKAAYHKNDGATGNYWNYPTASNTRPSNTLPDPSNHANLYDYPRTGNGNYTIGSPYYRTEVGAFLNSPSAYDTFDQGGNVEEWTETIDSTSLRIVHGGSYERGIESDSLEAYRFGAGSPTIEWPFIGFRMAGVSVPEPASMLLIGAITPFVFSRRKTR